MLCDRIVSLFLRISTAPLEPISGEPSAFDKLLTAFEKLKLENHTLKCAKKALEDENEKLTCTNNHLNSQS